MDMTRYLKPYLTVPQLEALGGEYDGVIVSVTDEEIRDRYTGQRSNQPVVSFLDGKRLVLNRGMLRACIGWFGADSKNWIGRRVRLFLRRVEAVNRETGETRVRLHRAILCEDPHAISPCPARRLGTAAVDPVREREPGEDDDAPSSTKHDGTAVPVEPVGAHDCD